MEENKNNFLLGMLSASKAMKKLNKITEDLKNIANEDNYTEEREKELVVELVDTIRENSVVIKEYISSLYALCSFDSDMSKDISTSASQLTEALHVVTSIASAENSYGSLIDGKKWIGFDKYEPDSGFELSSIKEEFSQIKDAFADVKMKGYGVVSPKKEEIHLDEPVIIKQGSRYGVKIRSEAPSIHMIRANIETEIAPIVGSEKQAEDLVAYIKKESEGPQGVWGTNIFGKSIEDLVMDGMRNKITLINEESQVKLQDSMQKIVNDSNGGLVCIII